MPYPTRHRTGEYWEAEGVRPETWDLLRAVSADTAGRVTWNDAKAISSAVALVPDHEIRVRTASVQKELQQARLFVEAYQAALEIPYEPKPLPAFPEMPPIDGALESVFSASS